MDNLEEIQKLELKLNSVELDNNDSKTSNYPICLEVMTNLNCLY